MQAGKPRAHRTPPLVSPLGDARCHRRRRLGSAPAHLMGHGRAGKLRYSMRGMSAAGQGPVRNGGVNNERVELALAGLAGGADGFLGHLASSFLTRGAERERQRIQLVEMVMRAFQDWDGVKPVSFVPLMYEHFGLRLLELLEAGKLTPEKYRELLADSDELLRIADERRFNDARRSP